ncbi:peptidase M15 [Kribbella capetownensis]|uniref:Peptidase M15 n=1 Tax=Kribbella capetownensis TaxID=1572659 RepID=A0A4R0JPB1_9ACTN|nr:M15 family metallopeptidase [Kribbella capetownensis]TCC43825.1 peptidase M15 [Kribbella capetownensis]
MTNDVPPRRTGSVRLRLLSVTGAGVAVLAVGSLLLWHAQLGEMLGLAADKEPVISTVNAPANSAPPTTLVTETPTPPPSRPSTPTTTPSKPPRKTPKPTKKSTTTPEYGEESINGLSPTLKSRLKKAMAAAKRDGVTLRINSGRRSAAKQQRLFTAALKKYGSYTAATRWVLPPKYSAHVQGKAVDIAPAAAMTWLNRNGWRYGVCRRYDNEAWHFEALTAPGRKCPPREPYALPKSD